MMQKINIITLLTDFGLNDNFVGVMKGVILKINPKADIIDISHNIRPQDIFGASFLLKSSYKYFPKKTVFLVIIDPGVGSKRKSIIVQSRNYFFVGPDNGVLSLAAREDKIKKIVMIENKRYFLEPISNTFHGRDILAPAAARLSKYKRMDLFGRTLKSIKHIGIPKTKLSKNVLRGKIIYIDRFGNLITNIDKNLFIKFTKSRKYEIKIKNIKFNAIAKSYQSVKPGKPLAIFGSFGFLEISVNGGSAKNYLQARKDTPLTII